MRLHNIISPNGSTHRRKRVGRGEGSGMGKTSCRGGKGQTARAGFSQRPGFESGHIQTHRKLPKRGFSNFLFKQRFAIINIGDLESLGLTTIDRVTLINAGVIRSKDGPLKILGNGDLSSAITVHATKITASAKAKIESAGGTVNIVNS